MTTTSSTKMAVLLSFVLTAMAMFGPARSSMINNGHLLRFINTYDENVLLENRQFGPRPMGIAQGLSQGGGGGGGGGGGDAGALDFISNPDTARFLFVMFVMQVSFGWMIAEFLQMYCPRYRIM